MFYLTITSVEQILFEGEVSAVNCPASEGELTILPNHSPLITRLSSGTIRVRNDKESRKLEFPVKHGLLEVSRNQATILV